MDGKDLPDINKSAYLHQLRIADSCILNHISSNCCDPVIQLFATFNYRNNSEFFINTGKRTD